MTGRLLVAAAVVGAVTAVVIRAAVDVLVAPPLAGDGIEDTPIVRVHRLPDGTWPSRPAGAHIVRYIES